MRTAELRRCHWKVTYWGERFPEENLEKYADRLRYAVWQAEVCPTTERPHWQCYLEFHTAVSDKFIRYNFFNGDKGWYRPRDRSRNDERAYCKKLRTRASGPPDVTGPFEWGDWVEDNETKGELAEVKQKIDDGMPMDAIAQEHFATVVKNVAPLRAYRQMQSQTLAQSKVRNVTVTVLYGPTGTGKTNFAKTEAMKILGDEDLRNIYMIVDDGNTMWFDGYESQKVLIMDEYNSGFQIQYLLNLLDVNPVRLNLKNFSMWGCWEHVYITSNKHPNEWTNKPRYGQNVEPISEVHKEALFRRIHRIILCPAPWEMVVEKDVRATKPEIEVHGVEQEIHMTVLPTAGTVQRPAPSTSYGISTTPPPSSTSQAPAQAPPPRAPKAPYSNTSKWYGYQRPVNWQNPSRGGGYTGPRRGSGNRDGSRGGRGYYNGEYGPPSSSYASEAPPSRASGIRRAEGAEQAP